MYAEFKYVNGDVYKGEWKDNGHQGTQHGTHHGMGTFTRANGNGYVGELVNHKKHGRGKFTWVNGAVYDDAFVDNERNDIGRYTWPSGDVYVGDWLNSKRHGRGTFTNANGKVYDGEWVNEQRNDTIACQIQIFVHEILENPGRRFIPPHWD